LIGQTSDAEEFDRSDLDCHTYSIFPFDKLIFIAIAAAEWTLHHTLLLDIHTEFWQDVAPILILEEITHAI
jgi:hypothetical protein